VNINLFSAVCYAETIDPSTSDRANSVDVIAFALDSAEEKGSDIQVDSVERAADAAHAEATHSGTQTVIEHDSVSSISTNNKQGISFSQIDSDYDIGHFEEALWALQDLLKLYPNNGDVLYRIGLVQEGMLDFDASREAYEQAVKSMETPFLAYSHLGRLLYTMNDYKQAIVAFEHVMKLKPDSAYSSYMLGMSYMNTGDFSASIEALERAGEIDASFKQKSIYGQGISYIRMGQNAKGQALLKESIALDPKSNVAALAKKSLADAVKLENTSYFSVFGLYSFQYDSNVVLNPSSSDNIPVISGTTDFAHTFFAALNYAPPPDGRLGYKVSARFYHNLHAKLRTFDVTGIGFTFTPYVSINDKNLLFLDAAYDYYLFNDKRYMDTISLKPTLTYSYNNQLQLMGSVFGSRENYYQPVELQTSNQDGWILKEELKIFGFSEDQRSSVQLGGHFTTGRTRGTDWSYNAYGGNAGVDVAIPYVEKLTAGLHGSIARHKYLNLDVNTSLKRRDTVYGGSASLSYHFTYADVSIMGSYTHQISTIEVYSYVRMMTGVNISGSF